LRQGRVLAEAFRSLVARPRRTVLTMLSVAVAVALYLLAFGLSESSTRSLREAIARPSENRLAVHPLNDRGADSPLSWEALDNFKDVPLVLAVSAIAQGDQSHVVQVRNLTDPLRSPSLELPVLASSGDLLTVTQLAPVEGREITSIDGREALRVAVLGSSAARLLNVAFADGRVVVTIDGIPFALVGIAPDGLGREIDAAVIVPYRNEIDDEGLQHPDELRVLTVSGAAHEVSKVASAVAVPFSPSSARSVVEVNNSNDVGELLDESTAAVLQSFAAVLGLVSVVGINSAVMSSVGERRTEIGLKRALGASRVDVFVEFMASGAMLGLAGVVCGMLAGLTGIALAALWNDWIPVLSSSAMVTASAAGVAMALVASVLPSNAAASLDPAAVLAEP